MFMVVVVNVIFWNQSEGAVDVCFPVRCFGTILALWRRHPQFSSYTCLCSLLSFSDSAARPRFSPHSSHACGEPAGGSDLWQTDLRTALDQCLSSHADAGTHIGTESLQTFWAVAYAPGILLIRHSSWSTERIVVEKTSAHFLHSCELGSEYESCWPQIHLGERFTSAQYLVFWPYH